MNIYIYSELSQLQGKRESPAIGSFATTRDVLILNPSSVFYVFFLVFIL